MKGKWQIIWIYVLFTSRTWIVKYEQEKWGRSLLPIVIYGAVSNNDCKVFEKTSKHEKNSNKTKHWHVKEETFQVSWLLSSTNKEKSKRRPNFYYFCHTFSHIDGKITIKTYKINILYASFYFAFIIYNNQKQTPSCVKLRHIRSYQMFFHQIY